tara:strand:- start:11591 stop:12184 length:594 start_codon:yes stop_codon:yes gene_type:complete
MPDLFSMTVNLSGREKNQTLQTLRQISSNIKLDIETATRITAKQGLTVVAREIQSELGKGITQKNIKTKLSQRKIHNGNRMIVIAKSGRYPMKMFKPRQNATGVSYKMRQTQQVRGGFMGPTPKRKAAKLRGHVWKRINSGPQRFPITPLYVASPWGVMNPDTSRLPLLQFAAAEISIIFEKQIQRRLNYRLHLLSR